MRGTRLDPPAEIRHADAEACLARIRELSWKRELARAQSDLTDFELGQLLSVARSERYSEKSSGKTFKAFVESLTDKNGSPRRTAWANKLIEMSRALEGYAPLRAYQSARLLNPATPCAHPDLSRRGDSYQKFPCVTTGSMYRAAKLVTSRKVYERTVAALDLDRDDLSPDERVKMGEDKKAAEALRLAHYSVAELDNLIRLESGDGEKDEGQLVSRILKLDPNIANEFDRILDEACSLELHGEGDAINPSLASSTQKVERLVSNWDSLNDELRRRLRRERNDDDE